ncbi:PREDICTED: early endosome antigen 1-like isoform X2 [Amphimedon queenslandica]|uniref:Uncharacterized protein n=1 Tax=Amphimedon queenslandica TaxID=400682 RepID=A0AAN0IX19_AMPQE|nr:PREDICTED: early endosome antigen 1-like isoform X2 [Amphimedon queenslandica]|eukprot:XP_019848993.1 PREDICTED: early endosome antigen 1-like isoform X2 [Amphimedon queenslandica]
MSDRGVRGVEDPTLNVKVSVEDLSGDGDRKLKTNPFEAEGSGTSVQWPPIAVDYPAELQSLKDAIQEKEETHLLEISKYKESSEKQLETIDKLQNKVSEYRTLCFELENKLDNLSKIKSEQSQFPSETIKKLETRVKELMKEKEDNERSYMDEIQSMILDNNKQTHRSLQLSASNTTLLKQLEDSQEIIKELRASNEKLTERNKSISLAEKNKASAVNSIVGVKNKAAVLRTDFEIMKEESTKEIHELNEKMKLLAREMKEHMEEKMKEQKTTQEQMRVFTEISTLQEDYALQLETYKDLVEELETELASVKELKEEAEQKVFEAVKKSEDLEAQIVALKNEKTIVAGIRDRDIETLQDALLNVTRLFVDGEKVTVDLFKDDVDEGCDWIMSTVTNGFNSLHCTIEKQETELVIAEERVAELTSLLMNEKDQKVETYSAAGLMKRELNICQSQLNELSQTKVQLQGQIENIVSQKMEVDSKLSEYQESLALLEAERSETLEAQGSLEKRIKDLENETKGIQMDKEGLEAEMTKKKYMVARLQQSINQSQREVKELQDKLSSLKTEKMDMEKVMFDTKSKVSMLELEKDLLEKELKDVQQSEQTLLERMVEFQQANSILESEKRALQESLDNMSAKQNKLDRMNSVLVERKQSQDDEVERLRSTNRLLTDQVDTLDKNLQELESICVRLRKEKSSLKQEAILLNEAFVKTRSTLSEVQIQRGQLNQSVAKIVQEKALLVQEKIQLASNIAHLEESLKCSLQTIAILSKDKDDSEISLKELSGELESSRDKVFQLENSIITLREEKQSEAKESKEAFEAFQVKMASEIDKSKEEAQKLKEELQIKIAGYEKSLSTCKKSHELEISELKGNHSQEVMSLIKNHETMVAKLQNELEEYKKESEAAIGKAVQDKEATVVGMEKEKDLMVERLELEIKREREKSSELEQEKKELEVRTSELTDQLKASEENAETLSKELNYIEGQIQKLQTILDEVKNDAEGEINQLKTDLSNSASKVIELEEKTANLLLAIKHHENNTSSAKKQLQEAQDILDRHLKETQRLMTDKQSLERQLGNIQSNYAQAFQTISQYEEKFSEREEEKNQALGEGRRLRKLLQFSEQALAKLTDDHKQLEGSYTTSQKELNLSRLQVRSLREELREGQQVIEEYKHKVADLEGRLSVAMSGFVSKEEDLKNALEMIQSLRGECFDLKTSLESSKSESRGFSDEVALLKVKLEDLKVQRSEIVNTVQSLEESFETERKNNQSLRQEIAAVKVAKSQREEELVELVKTYQELRSLHHQFIAALEGNLDPELASEFESATNVDEYVAEAKTNPNTTILLSSLVSGSLESGTASPGVTLTSPLPPPPLSTSPITKSPETLASFVSKLQNNLLSLRKAKESIKGELEESVTRMAALFEQKEAAEKQVQRLMSINREKDGSLQVALKTNSELQSTIDSQINEIRELSLKIDEVCNLQRRTAEELDLCRVKNQAAVIQLSKLSDHQVLQEIEKKEMQSELNKAKLTTVLQENELMRLSKEKEKWAMLEMERETKLRNFEEEKYGMELISVKTKSEIKELEKKLCKAIESREEILAAYKSQQEVGRGLEREKETLMSNSLKTEELLKREIQDLTKTKVGYEKELSKLQDEMNKLKLKMVQSESARKESERKMTTLLGKFEEIKLEKSSAAEKADEEKGLRDILIKQVNVLKSKLEREILNNSSSKEAIGHLQKEIERKKREICASREELRKAKHEISALIIRQTEFKNTLSASYKLNTDLAAKIEEKEKKHQKELQVLQQGQKKDENMLKISQKLFQTQWEGKESEYKNLIKQLEKKVQLLDESLIQLKVSRDEIISKADKQDKAIATFHKYLSHERPSSTERPHGRGGEVQVSLHHGYLSDTSI